jgi:hypothetical protein
MNKKARERVAIAKDALAWVEAGALTPQCGVYVRPTIYPTQSEVYKQLRDVYLGKCEVCARGALFLAKAVRFDNVLAGNFNMPSANLCALEEHFEFQQIALIENYFEGRSVHWVNYNSDLYIYWARRHPSSSERMTLILQNIIDNDGTFVPEKLP